MAEVIDLRLLRWLVALLLGAGAFALVWWVCDAQAQLDVQSSVGVAATAAALVGTPLGWWASREPAGAVPAGSVVMVYQQPHPQPAGVGAPVVIGAVPRTTAAFRDREEVSRRLRELAGDGRTAVVCTVTGPRGVGKTQAAAAYVRLRYEQGWPVVLWLDAEVEQTVISGYAELAAEVGVRGVQVDDLTAARAGLRWLSRQPGPCLVVFDNATDVDLVGRWTPSLGAVQTVVTTTHAELEVLGMPVPVDVFTPEEAVGYLRERTGLSDEAGARALAEELGWLPLALAQAGAVIGSARRYRSYQAYRQALRALELDEVLGRVAGSAYPRSVSAAVLLSLHELAVVDADGLGRRLLELLSVLAPSGVSFAVLYRLADGDDGDSGGVSTARVDQAAAVLASRSLAWTSQNGSQLVVHRLVRRVVRDAAAKAGNREEAVLDADGLVYRATVDVPRPWPGMAEGAELAQHAAELWQHATDCPETVRAEVLTTRGFTVDRLNDESNPGAAIPAARQVLDDHVQMLGPDHPDTLTSANRLAGAYESAGRLGEAIELFERTLADRVRVLGDDHPDTLRSRNNLAGAYESAGRLGEAIELYERTLADRVRLLGEDHPITLTSRHNLACAFLKAERLAEAVELHERTLADSARLLGEDHPGTLTSRNNLAGAYESAGRVAEAIELYERTLADSVRVLGEDHPGTLTSRHSLAYTYESAGRVAEAIELYERTLADRVRLLGDDHPDTLTTRNNLACAYESAGRVAEAIELHERTLADRVRVLGEEHPDTLTSRDNLAGTYESAGRSPEATGRRDAGAP